MNLFSIFAQFLAVLLAMGFCLIEEDYTKAIFWILVAIFNALVLLK